MAKITKVKFLIETNEETGASNILAFFPDEIANNNKATKLCYSLLDERMVLCVRFCLRYRINSEPNYPQN